MVLFKVPVNILLSGPSQSGKSTFVIKLIKNIKTLFKTEVKEILYCTSLGHNLQNKIPRSVKIYKGVPSAAYFSDRIPRLVILDDMLYEIDKNMIEIFTKKSHHLNFAVIFLSQSIFSRVKGKTIIVLVKNKFNTLKFYFYRIS